MRHRRVVIAIDFSERSIAAAQWVGRSFAPDAELILAHVVELPPPPRFLRPGHAWNADDVEACRAEASERLRQIGRLIGKGLIWEEVREGRAYEEVLRLAWEYDADLIVVGSHRDKPGFWNRFGSTAERILGGSRTSVLVVHGAPSEAPRRLLAAVDDSASSGKVLAHAEALTQNFGASGSVLHVLPRQAIHRVLLPNELIVNEEYLIDVEKECIDETRDWLGGRLSLPNALTPTVLLGDAAEAILAEGQRIGADLLVLGRDRKSKVRRYLLGSVTSTVLRGANCPVLVIPSADSSHFTSLPETGTVAEMKNVRSSSVQV